jgi:hypothetical protein
MPAGAVGHHGLFPGGRVATHMNDFAAHKSGLDALEARLKAHMAAETSRAKFEMLTW